MVSIGASQALDPGSIPGHRNFDKIKFIRATKYNTSAFFYHVSAHFIIKNFQFGSAIIMRFLDLK